MKKVTSKTKIILAAILVLILVVSCVIALRNQAARMSSGTDTQREALRAEENRTLSHEACWIIFGAGALIIVVTLIRAGADRRRAACAQREQKSNR